MCRSPSPQVAGFWLGGDFFCFGRARVAPLKPKSGLPLLEKDDSCLPGDFRCYCIDLFPNSTAININYHSLIQLVNSSPILLELRGLYRVPFYDTLKGCLLDQPETPTPPPNLCRLGTKGEGKCLICDGSCQTWQPKQFVFSRWKFRSVPFLLSRWLGYFGDLTPGEMDPTSDSRQGHVPLP